MNNGNDKAANIQRIVEVAQTHRGIFWGEAPEPEELKFTDENAISIAEILTRPGTITRDIPTSGIWYESGRDARLLISQFSGNEIKAATYKHLAFQAQWDEEYKGLIKFAEDEQLVEHQYLYGRLPSEDVAATTLFREDFTEKNADTLVTEVTNKWAGIIGITDRAAISETLRPIVESSLYKHWTIVDGEVVQGAPTVITGVSSIWADSLEGIYQNMDMELLQDPRHLLRADKVELVLESMVLADTITSLQKGYVLFPNRPLSTQEREELGGSDADISAYAEMMSKVVQFADDNFDNAFNRMVKMPSVGTLSEAFNFFVGEDLKKPLPDSSQPPPEGGWRDLTPVGYDEVTQRQIESEQQFLSAFGKSGKPFKDRVTDLMTNLEIKTNTNLIIDPILKKATEDANSLLRDSLEAVRANADAEGLDDEEIFRAVYAAAEEIVQGGNYQQILDQRAELRGQYNLTTDPGRSSFLKDRFPDSALLTTDERIQMLSDIAGMSFDEATEYINENLGPAIQRSQREKYDDTSLSPHPPQIGRAHV